MAVVAGQGHSMILNNRRFEDWKSLKQHFAGRRRVDEVHIHGSTTTDGATKEIDFCVDDIINYIAAEGQVYIRTAVDDVARQGTKYVYIEYQDDTGAVKTILTADLDDTNTTTEVIVTGAADFYRLRRMACEVVADTTKGVVLTDSAMGGADDVFGFISDTDSEFSLQRFFTQPDATCDSYLAHVHTRGASTGGAATDDTFFLEITFTPRPTNLGEVAAAAAKTLHFEFQDEMRFEHPILLDGGTEVSFNVGDNASAGIIQLEAVLVEVYPE